MEAVNGNKLHRLCRSGLRERFGENPEPEVLQRLRHELSAIDQKGWGDGLCFVAGLLRDLREKRFAVGPGRGSSPGSLVAYLLRITDVDPIANDLIFEGAFKRAEDHFPFVEIECSEPGLRSLMDSLIQRYGLLFPDKPVVLARLVNGTEQSSLEAIQNSDQGVVISQGRHIDEIELARYLKSQTSDENEPSFPLIPFMVYVFADQRMNLIERTLWLIHESTGEHLDLERRTEGFSDPAVYSSLKKGELSFTVSPEGAGKIDLLKYLQPSCFSDLIAYPALYRPGPLESLLFDEFVGRKEGDFPIECRHPMLIPILKDSYQITMYFEQITQIARQLAGFSADRAELFTNDVQKREYEEIQIWKQEIVKGAAENGIPVQVGEDIFQNISL